MEGVTVSEDLLANPSPPRSTALDLNRVPLGQIAAQHPDRVDEIVGGADTSGRPRAQFMSAL
jgi:hypothetical protein